MKAEPMSIDELERELCDAERCAYASRALLLANEPIPNEFAGASELASALHQKLEEAREQQRRHNEAEALRCDGKRLAAAISELQRLHEMHRHWTAEHDLLQREIDSMADVPGVMKFLAAQQAASGWAFGSGIGEARLNDLERTQLGRYTRAVNDRAIARDQRDAASAGIDALLREFPVLRALRQVT